MLKDKLKRIGSCLRKNGKIVVPVSVVLVVAVIVSVSLQANDDRIQGGTSEVANMESTESAETMEPIEATPEPTPVDDSLKENADIRPLMCTYYNAYALGDMETIKSITNYMDETEEIRMKAMSEYVESYPEITVYTKPGPIENSYLAYVYYKMTVKNFEEQMSGMETFYVCTNESGELYINKGEVTDEELEYIRLANAQDDVVELYNRVTVECNEVFLNNAELFYYIQEVVDDVKKSTGETLAAQMSSEAESSESTEGSEGSQSESISTESENGSETETPQETSTTEVIYAKAITTVNVRVSDSEQADKAGKISKGTKVEVIEQQVNGWSKIKTDDLEGYIKSEFLQVISVTDSTDAVGTVTATTNVNVREAAAEDAGRLGVLVGGETVELLAIENGWCKINYYGEIGYVKQEFVQ